MFPAIRVFMVLCGGLWFFWGSEKPKMDPGVQLMSLGVCLSPSGGSAFFFVGFIPRKTFSHIKAKMAVASASFSSKSVRKDPEQPNLGHVPVSD